MNNKMFKCIILLAFFAFCFFINPNIGMKLFAYFCDPCIFITALVFCKKNNYNK